MDGEPECYKCQDWRRMGLSDRCPYHDRIFWQSVDEAKREVASWTEQQRSEMRVYLETDQQRADRIISACREDY